MHKNLNEFVKTLEQQGELKRIATEVSPTLELSEIVDRISKSPSPTGEEGGSALLFEKTGTNFPVLCNMLGSERRLALALGGNTVDDIASKVAGFLSEAKRPRKSLMDKFSALSLLGNAAKWFPKHKRGRGECQEVVYRGEDIDLSMLPIPKTWPHDGGKFITLPLVHTIDPSSGARNVGMYRMQVFSKNSTGMHWHIHKTGARHYEEYKRRGERMPVSVVLGGDPIYTYCATAPLPEGIDEYILAGFLRGKPVRLVKCLTNELEVPHDADIVLEGYVDPTEGKVVEGPFGDHTGFYSLADLYPTFHITAITHKRGAIYPATLVGIPPMEDRYLALLSEKIFESPIREVIAPEVRSMWMPWQGVAHNLALVEVENSYPGVGLKVASALWGAGQMSFCKVVWVSDRKITEAALKSWLFGGESFRAELTFSQGVTDVLDHASEVSGRSSKLCVDMVSEVAREWRAEVVFNDGVEGLNDDDKIWQLLANLEPLRDIVLDNEKGVVKIDGRSKKLKHRATPNVVTMNDKTIELVDTRWGEYGLGNLVESPSRRYQKLVNNDGAEEVFETHDHSR